MVSYFPKLAKVETEFEHEMKLKATDLIVEGHVTLDPKMNILEALNILSEHSVTGAPVIDHQNRLVGYLSEKDCLCFVLRMKYNNAAPGNVSDYMATTLMTLKPTDSFLHCLELFIKNNYQAYPIVDSGVFVGMVTRSSVLSEINSMGHTERW